MAYYERKFPAWPTMKENLNKSVKTWPTMKENFNKSVKAWPTMKENLKEIERKSM